MRALFYDPDHAEFIGLARNFLIHVDQCPDCKQVAEGDGRAYMEELFNALNSITSEDIPMFDYDADIAFCHLWMDRHFMLQNLSALEHPHGTA